MAIRPLMLGLIFFFLSTILISISSIPQLLLGSSKTIPFNTSISTASITKQRSKSNARSSDADEHSCDLSSLDDNTMCCDRSNFKTDVCAMRGDVRIHSPSSTLYLVNSSAYVNESIKPYPRKWEAPIMSTVEPLHLVALPPHAAPTPKCDVHHDAPALVFYTGGYTGNLYHEFLDGIVPLYISAADFDKEVVFVVVKYRKWWDSKYGDILSALSAFPRVDFLGDRRVHCFQGAVVGLRIHEELSIDAGSMHHGRSIVTFREMLEEAYGARSRGCGNWRKGGRGHGRLTIISRDGARGLEEEEKVVGVGREVGFEEVDVVRPGPTTDLAEMYSKMNSTDVVVGAHGAALTHFLFMRPGAVLVQIVPLGLSGVAETCFGKGARRMGLRYMKYDVLPHESSLYRKYPKDDPVLTDPAKMAAKGWEVIKDLYLEQTIKLDIDRFRKLILVEAYEYVKSMKSLPSG